MHRFKRPSHEVIYVDGPAQIKARPKRKNGYNTGFGMGIGGGSESSETDSSDEEHSDSDGNDAWEGDAPTGGRSDSIATLTTTPHGGNQDVKGGQESDKDKDGDGDGDEEDVGEGGPDLPEEGEGMGTVEDEEEKEKDRESKSESPSPVTPLGKVEEVEGGTIETVKGASGAALFIDEAKEADAKPNEHFTHEEFGEHTADLRLYDELHHTHPAEHPYLNFIERHVKPSPARQFFIGNTFYRERKARKVAWEELFSDLVYVAVIQQVSHSIKEAPILDAGELNHLVLIFAPIWLTWISNHNYSNTFGTTSSFWHRLHAWLQMLLVCGLGITCSHAFDPDPSQNTARPYAIIYLFSRVLYILSYSKVFISMPKFKAYVAVRMAGVVLASVPWVVAIFVVGKTQEVVWWVGLVLDLAARGGTYVATWVGHKIGRGMKYRLAMNIEHSWERYGLLTMIVLGELVVSILWTSKKNQFEQTYAATILGLTITICVQWIYYAIDGGKQFKHALRRHPLTAFLFQLLHLPLHTTLVLSGASLAILILRIGHIDYVHPNIDASSPVEPWLRYFFICGFGVVLWWLTLISGCHKSLEDGNERVSKKGRIAVRVVCGAGLVAFGIASGKRDTDGDGITAMGMIGVVAGVYVFVTFFEQFGRMKRRKVEDEESASPVVVKQKKRKGRKKRVEDVSAATVA